MGGSRVSGSSADQDLWVPKPMRSRAVRLARRYTGDPEEAEDVVQEALIRAWRHRDRLVEQEKLWPWLARIVANEAMRSLARKRWEREPDVGEESPADDALLASAPQRLDLARGLERLDRADRELLRMRYYLDLTQVEIAARLGLPEGTVKVRLHRVRARLRRDLTP